MDEKIKKLWAENKLVFFLLLPLIILFVFRDVVLAILTGSARKISQETAKKDADFKSQQDAANLEADRLRKEADEAGKEKPNVGEDWNKDWHK